MNFITFKVYRLIITIVYELYNFIDFDACVASWPEVLRHAKKNCAGNKSCFVAWWDGFNNLLVTDWIWNYSTPRIKMWTIVNAKVFLQYFFSPHHREYDTKFHCRALLFSAWISRLIKSTIISTSKIEMLTIVWAKVFHQFSLSSNYREIDAKFYGRDLFLYEMKCWQ